MEWPQSFCHYCECSFTGCNNSVIDKLCYWFFGWWDKQCAMLNDVVTFSYPKPRKIKKPLKNTECPKCKKDFGCVCGD